jgi:hypothetical protein
MGRTSGSGAVAQPRALNRSWEENRRSPADIDRPLQKQGSLAEHEGRKLTRENYVSGS